MTPITTIIIVILILMLFVILAVITIYIRKKEKTNTRPNPPLEQPQQEYLFDDISDQTDYISDKNKTDVFEQITSLIKSKLHMLKSMCVLDKRGMREKSSGFTSSLLDSRVLWSMFVSVYNSLADT